MTVKTSGAEWKLFYADQTAWPEGAYHDDTMVSVNGVTNPDIDLGAVVDTDLLEVHQGQVMFPDGHDLDLVDHFTAWKNAQSTSFVVFQAPNDKLDAIKAAIIAAGGTISVA